MTRARAAWAMPIGLALMLSGADLLAARNHTFDWTVHIFGSLILMIFAAMGALVASRVPRNPVGWVMGLGAGLVGFGGSGFLAEQYATHALKISPGSLPGGAMVGAFADPARNLGFFAQITFLLLLVPTGRLPSRRWRPVAWGAAVDIGVVALVSLFAPGPLQVGSLQFIQNPLGFLPTEVAGSAPVWIANLALIAFVALSIASVVVRYRRAKGDERLQIKWFAYAAIFPFVVFGGFLLIINGVLPFQGLRAFAFSPRALNLIFPLSISLIPVATAISILRYRLFDIDVVIRKTVVFGVLAALITGIYALLVIAPAVTIFGTGGKGFMLPLAATVVIALTFQPARRRAQHFANRLVYGKRVTPYEAMAEFSQRMAGAISLEEVLPRMAETAALGIGAIQSRVRLFLPDGGERSASWPESGVGGHFERTVDVVYQAEKVGEIAVAKSRADPITPAEERLLADLATQAGPALRNVRLTEDLRASRRRIVSAQDEERRRMERDIHDGAQQLLVSMAVKVGLAKNLTHRDPDKASQLLDDLARETNDALSTLRDLARGLFPQMLVERGLAIAIESHVQKVGIDARVEDRLNGARFDLEAEANVYFVVREALQNASKHAPGAPVTVTLAESEGFLDFSVKDDGPGFDLAKASRGSGLHNMADRIEALGGTLDVQSQTGAGTTVKGRVPVPIVEAAR